MTEKKIKIPVKQLASGLTVPADAKVDEPCHHTEVAQRAKPQLTQYHCHDCDDKVFFVVMQGALMTQMQLEDYQRKMNKAIVERIEAQKVAGLGLVLPGDEQAK